MRKMGVSEVAIILRFHETHNGNELFFPADVFGNVLVVNDDRYECKA